MKGTVLAAIAVFGLSILLAGIGPAFAGGNDPQEVGTWQYEEAVETGRLPEAEVEKPKMEADSLPGHGESGAFTDFDADPRWKESGGG